MIRVFPSLEHSTDCVRKPADNFRTFVCVPYWHLWTKHNRAKPMFELPSAIFLIADGNEFRFARFYIVCEEVPLGTPESPPIVSGVSDMHPSDCPNVEETRNPMQTFSRKKCSHFSPTNIPSAFPSEIEGHGFLGRLLITAKRDRPPKASVPLLCLCIKTSLLCQQFSDWSHNTLRSLPALSRAEVIWSWMLCDLLPQTALSLS